MQFREHRGGLGDSMATLFRFNTLQEFMRHVADIRPDIISSGASVAAEPYGGDDDRIGWKNVHVVTENGRAFGFTDGPLPAPDRGDCGG